MLPAQHDSRAKMTRVVMVVAPPLTQSPFSRLTLLRMHVGRVARWLNESQPGSSAHFQHVLTMDKKRSLGWSKLPWRTGTRTAPRMADENTLPAWT